MTRTWTRPKRRGDWTWPPCPTCRVCVRSELRGECWWGPPGPRAPSLPSPSRSPLLLAAVCCAGALPDCPRCHSAFALASTGGLVDAAPCPLLRPALPPPDSCVCMCLHDTRAGKRVLHRRLGRRGCDCGHPHLCGLQLGHARHLWLCGPYQSRRNVLHELPAAGGRGWRAARREDVERIDSVCVCACLWQALFMTPEFRRILYTWQVWGRPPPLPPHCPLLLLW